ncbi:MAG: carboxypeptidase regulatory-like domain-containing protein [Acidobacteria bacterium]|nr:carboxypeptidase regulatory-like domain-containing protein [Acidobacteriota bacterium]
MRRHYFVLLPALACLAAALVHAQDRGTIMGRVTDPSNAVVAGANITVTSQETGVKVATTTNEVGNYAVRSLPFGRYEVACEAKGFRGYVRKDNTLDVGQTLTLDLELQLGAVDQTVEVTGAAPLIESSTSDLGTVVDRKQVQDLPLSVNGNMRNPESFVFLAPGVSGDTANTEINGSQDRAKEVLVDGAQATGPESGGTVFTYPPVESIGEFKLESSNFSAEYGKTGGGFEVFTTKSGTNQFHGSLFEYLRNDVLDARGFISPKTPVNRQNEFGVAIGGPVMVPKYNGRNRTFFYFVYDGFRYRAGATNQVLTLPNAAQRAGDFSGLTKGGAALAVYDPASTTSDGAGGFTRTMFPGAKIPVNRFSKVSAAMLALLPAANTSAATANYTAVGAQTFDRNAVTIKGDHSFNDRNRVSLFAYVSNESSIAPALIEGAMSPALNQQRPARWFRFNYDMQISPTVLNNFRGGYTREPQQWARVTSDQGLLGKIGLTGVNPPGDIIPRVQFSDTYQNWSDETKNKGLQVNNTLQFADTIAIFRGNHSLKFGADMRWQQTNGADSAGQQGLFAFNPNETALPTAAGRAASGNAFASFLLGAVDSASYNGLFVVPGLRYEYKALFAQDDWKVSRKLTLNIGLRWDLFTPRREHNTNISGFDPSIPNPGAGNLPGAIAFLGSGPGRDSSRSSFANTFYKAFGPRFGFASQLAKNTVLRGGYGISYGQGNANAGLRDSQKFVYGFNAAPSYASTNAGVTPAFGWDDGFPTNWPKPPFINPTVQNGTNVTMIGPNDGRPPMFQNFTFSVQQAISERTSIEAAYVGVKGQWLGNGLISLNQVNPQYLALGSLLTQSVTSAAAQAAGIKVPYAGFTGSVAQALRPYPQFLNIVNNSNPNGNSTYHALQMKFTKRLSHGLTVLAAYTWSKSITDGNIAAGGGPSGQDFYNRRLEKAISTNDVPQIFVVAYTWDLPFGKGKAMLNNSGLLSHIVGGWQLSGIQQYSVGKPVSLTVNNSLPIFNGTLRPNLIQGVPLTVDHPDPLANPWFNKAAFAAPASYQFGTAARSYTGMRAPNAYNESYGLMRQIKATERVSVVLRGEFFNAFNRTVFGAPVANVSAANFGRVTSQANSPRQGQVSARIEF